MLSSTAVSVCGWAARLLSGTGLHQHQASRAYAVAVKVTDNNVEAALTRLRRKCVEADLPKEIKKRSHFIRNTDKKFAKQTVAYNRAMGRIINERIQWLEKKRLVR